MRQLTALGLAGAFVVGISAAAIACPGMKTASNPTTVASADQAAPSTKITIPTPTPKSGS